MSLKRLKLFFTNKLDIKRNNNKMELGDNVCIKYNNIKINGKNNTIFVGNGAVVKNCIIEINGDNNKIYINSEKIAKVKIQSVAKNSIIRFETASNIQDSSVNLFSDFGEVSIGKKTTFTSVNIVCNEYKNKIIIGNDCMFSYGIHIRNTDSHPIYNSAGELINKGKEIIIKDKVWIGMGVTILKGCIIEDGCVIGAGSLVNKSITIKNCIATGVPIKVIREDIIWERKFRN